jgi:diaminohydroxyphosphoribosylaminopyrimidine deaminase/5-amino-6-(5-phosphoribosylamino)uracil reductase
MSGGREDLMREALALALKGRGKVSPNPLVGAIVLKEGRVVGRGYHDGCGKPHAEVNALSEAGNAARGATMYVTLEPCHLWGRTPPCTDAMIKAGISRVIVATKDPNPSVSGAGIETLKKAGVEVEVGLMEKEARRMNESYFKFMSTGLPFIILKIAMTLDGKIAAKDGSSKWITGDAAREHVQSIRKGVDAILAGIGTVLADDPSLTVRDAPCERKPKRIILDSRLRIPPNAKVLDGSAPSVVATTAASPPQLKNVDIWPLESDASGRVSLDHLLKRAAEENITSILVEGGSDVFSSFLRERKVDKFMIFLAPKIMGSGLDAFSGFTARRLEDAFSLDITDVNVIGNDLVVVAYPRAEAELHKRES